MSLLTLFLTLLNFTLLHSTTHYVSENFIFVSHSNSLTFPESQNYCSTNFHSGNLASILNEDEQTIISDLLSSIPYTSTYWIGLQRSGTICIFPAGFNKGSQYWDWINGDTYSESTNNFKSGEPKECSDLYVTADATDNHRWNDKGVSNSENGFLCKYDNTLYPKQLTIGTWNDNCIENTYIKQQNGLPQDYSTMTGNGINNCGRGGFGHDFMNEWILFAFENNVLSNINVQISFVVYFICDPGSNEFINYQRFNGNHTNIVKNVKWFRNDNQCVLDFNNSFVYNLSWIDSCDNSYPLRRCYKNYVDSFVQSEPGFFMVVFNHSDSGANKAWAIADLMVELSTQNPTEFPSGIPTDVPSYFPSDMPSFHPSFMPSNEPSDMPSKNPSKNPSKIPTFSPVNTETDFPTVNPSAMPSMTPTNYPSITPTIVPTIVPTLIPSEVPSKIPSKTPTKSPTNEPSFQPSKNPSIFPTKNPSFLPTINPSIYPTNYPTFIPSLTPSNNPSSQPFQSTLTPVNDPQSQTPTISPLIPETLQSNTNSSLEKLLTILVYLVASFILILCLFCIFSIYKCHKMHHQTMTWLNSYKSIQNSNTQNRQRIELLKINSLSSEHIIQDSNTIGSTEDTNTNETFGRMLQDNNMGINILEDEIVDAMEDENNGHFSTTKGEVKNTEVTEDEFEHFNSEEITTAGDLGEDT